MVLYQEHSVYLVFMRSKLITLLSLRYTRRKPNPPTYITPRRLRSHGNRPASECESVTLHAFRSGYRHVDSARAYRNEQPCADAIRAFMKESGVPRSEIFFTSKVPPRAMGYENTKVR